MSISQHSSWKAEVDLEDHGEGHIGQGNTTKELSRRSSRSSVTTYPAAVAGLSRDVRALFVRRDAALKMLFILGKSARRQRGPDRAGSSAEYYIRK
jgi:hypothetical protein